MQIADTYSRNAPSPTGGAPTAEIAAQQRRARLHYRLLHFRRSLRFWWFRVLLVLVGTLVAVEIGPLLLSFPKEIFGGAAALIILFWVFRRLEFALILFALCSTVIVPKILNLKSVDVYPAHALVFLILLGIMVRGAFHIQARKFTLPSFWAIWPQLGLIALAILSEIMIQVSWISLVPHRLNTTPVIFSELLGIAMYAFPLFTIIITTACISVNENLIQTVQKTYLIAGGLAALVIGFEFRRIGADIYTFRYTEPVIIYMSLRGLAQLMSLAAIIAYVRLLTAEGWKWRAWYAALLLVYLACVYFTLENSWWVEVAVAFVVITVMYSKRLTLILAVCCLPLVPFLKNELVKLQTTKSADAYRLIIWQDSLRLWGKRPILGVGPGNFWPYDQIFTHLPVLLRNFDNTGLGVAHNGTLQTLGELGPLGVVFLYSFVVVVFVLAFRIYRRCKGPERRKDRALALICMGLVMGSIAGDFFAGSFFLPPRQIGSFQDLPQVLSTWIIFGCLFYRDKVWRQTHMYKEAVA